MVMEKAKALSARIKTPVLSSPKRTGPVSTGGSCAGSWRIESWLNFFDLGDVFTTSCGLP